MSIVQDPPPGRPSTTSHGAPDSRPQALLAAGLGPFMALVGGARALVDRLDTWLGLPEEPDWDTEAQDDSAWPAPAVDLDPPVVQRRIDPALGLAISAARPPALDLAPGLDRAMDAA